ncbi:hypothetical protein BDZ94DRAFT_61791 [Collybia nuda]|uniref:Uncharacterized protein n=1 Tax=Collybia nuda TaxID=64659 RepID=A0A9P5YEU2_9AGAR|nr:hypothetical protein BDZ94DRAFT_61791 [Collybia nuda]
MLSCSYGLFILQRVLRDFLSDMTKENRDIWISFTPSVLDRYKESFRSNSTLTAPRLDDIVINLQRRRPPVNPALNTSSWQTFLIRMLEMRPKKIGPNGQNYPGARARWGCNTFIWSRRRMCHPCNPELQLKDLPTIAGVPGYVWECYLIIY